MSDNKESEKRAKTAWAIIAIKSVTNRLNRYDQIKDPVTRANLLVDNFLSLFDIGTAILENEPDFFGLTESIKEPMQKLKAQLNKSLTFLSEYVQSPTLSPDHPVGLAMMSEAKYNCEEAFTQSKKS